MTIGILICNFISVGAHTHFGNLWFWFQLEKTELKSLTRTQFHLCVEPGLESELDKNKETIIEVNPRLTSNESLVLV